MRPRSRFLLAVVLLLVPGCAVASAGPAWGADTEVRFVLPEGAPPWDPQVSLRSLDAHEPVARGVRVRARRSHAVTFWLPAGAAPTSELRLLLHGLPAPVGEVAPDGSLEIDLRASSWTTIHFLRDGEPERSAGFEPVELRTSAGVAVVPPLSWYRPVPCGHVWRGGNVRFEPFRVPLPPLPPGEYVLTRPLDDGEERVFHLELERGVQELVLDLAAPTATRAPQGAGS